MEERLNDLFAGLAITRIEEVHDGQGGIYIYLSNGTRWRITPATYGYLRHSIAQWKEEEIKDS